MLCTRDDQGERKGVGGIEKGGGGKKKARGWETSGGVCFGAKGGRGDKP